MRTSPENDADGDGDSSEEHFYESLDRIISSSCSSTSASDDDAAGAGDRRRGFPRFPPPPAAAAADVWSSDPAPVAERRRRLLLQLGLIGDPALSRSNAGDSRRRSDFRRTDPAPIASPIFRSKSDGDVDLETVHKQSQPSDQPSPRSPPTPPAEKDDMGSDGGEENEEEDRRCTIKNLDNGTEFVVKEFRSEVREVGTGRQLTMEEFEMCVGRSPIVQELMRRQNVEGSSGKISLGHGGGLKAGPKRRGNWLRSIKNMAGSVVTGGYYYRARRNSEDRDSSSEKGGGRRSSSATDDSQDGSGSHGIHLTGPDRIRVRQYGKNYKELTGLYLTQEIQGHSGSIWSIKFSLDGRYLASAGEDCVIHVWEVTECKRKGDLVMEGVGGENGSCNPFLSMVSNESPESALALACLEGNQWEKRRVKVPSSRKSVSADHLMVPDQLFALGEKPVCSFKGHLDDVLDLSWSKSQYLLSSSMDKTVKLWHMSSNSCLKTFSHSDYVTCIQFNPVDDRYFISGSLDEKVRIWSIPDRQIVDWNDLHEMVTAACYTPDGQGALVGSHKGSCHLYDTSDNKLHQKSQIDLQNKKKKSNHKKITGFQFAPGSSSEVLVTSADSRIRVIDGVELVHKFKGFRNTSSQISASLATNGKFVVCASEDSHVYVWRYDADSQPNRSKGSVSVTQSYEHFHCQDVTVAIPWPSMTGVTPEINSSEQGEHDNSSPRANHQMQAESDRHESSPMSSMRFIECSPDSSILNTNTNHFSDRVTATWPEEKLLGSSNQSTPRSSIDLSAGRMSALQSRSAWGMVIVTAGRGGRIKTFQNFGIPIRL